MFPQENLKFSALRMPFSCILRAAQAIQTHEQHILQKDIIYFGAPHVMIFHYCSEQKK